MTKEELTKLDNLGHRELPELTEIQLTEYVILLHLRLDEVMERIMELAKGEER